MLIHDQYTTPSGKAQTLLPGLCDRMDEAAEDLWRTELEYHFMQPRGTLSDKKNNCCT